MRRKIDWGLRAPPPAKPIPPKVSPKRALAPCPVCGRYISRSAPTCPKCGSPLDEYDWEQADAKQAKAAKTAGGVIMSVVGVLIGLIVVGTLIGPSSDSRVADAWNPRVANAGEFGDRWPFPLFRSGKLGCSYSRSGMALPVIELGGRLYGLNGLAQEAFGLPDSREQMAIDHELGIYRLGAISEIRQRAVALCE